MIYASIPETTAEILAVQLTKQQAEIARLQTERDALVTSLNAAQKNIRDHEALVYHMRAALEKTQRYLRTGEWHEDEGVDNFISRTLANE